MESLFRYVAPPSPCGYLPDRRWSLEYEMVIDLTAEEYSQRMLQGWRRFGGMLFQPRCPSCSACQSLRIDVASFNPSRSQRRAAKGCARQVSLSIGPPRVSREKLQLYDRYHAHQARTRHWPEHPPKDVQSYRDSFVDNPSFTEEWCYSIDGKLVGVGYVDRLAAGLSAIYYFHDPACRPLSLGIWNVLCIIENARQHGLPHVYLGYYVEGCQSLEYKRDFQPNEILGADLIWRPFLSRSKS